MYGVFDLIVLALIVLLIPIIITFAFLYYLGKSLIDYYFKQLNEYNQGYTKNA